MTEIHAKPATEAAAGAAAAAEAESDGAPVAKVGNGTAAALGRSSAGPHPVAHTFNTHPFPPPPFPSPSGPRRKRPPRKRRTRSARSSACNCTVAFLRRRVIFPLALSLALCSSASSALRSSDSPAKGTMRHIQPDHTRLSQCPAAPRCTGAGLCFFFSFLFRDVYRPPPDRRYDHPCRHGRKGAIFRGAREATSGEENSGRGNTGR